MRIPFTQYMMPNGRQKTIEIDPMDSLTDKRAQALLDIGARFTAEVLTTGQVSVACEYQNEEGELENIAIELCTNGPEVTEAVIKMVQDAHKLVTARGGIKMDELRKSRIPCCKQPDVKNEGRVQIPHGVSWEYYCHACGKSWIEIQREEGWNGRQ